MQKLVRDLVPALMERDGCKVRVVALTGPERIGPLKQKLSEEAAELAKASSRKDMLEEVADIKEVYDALLRELHLSPQEVEYRQEEKRKKKGGFEKCYFVE